MTFFTDLVDWITRVGQGQVWLLALGIFAARIADQSFGTMRTISIFRGFKVLAAVFGFLEVLIWINVVAQVIRNLDEWYLGVVYAAGFAAGSFVGMWIESRLAMGHQMVRVISKREANLADKLWELNYAVVEMDGRTKTGEMDILFVAEKRRSVPKLLRQIHDIDPEAFFTVEDVKQVGLRQRDPSVVWGEKMIGDVGKWVTHPLKKRTKDKG
ncbi:MAG: DUF2179 domain-containing protein [Calditrichaeota bacterium]|nr:DUF2179 domain-containing protein [Calditrichota bacterium]